MKRRTSCDEARCLVTGAGSGLGRAMARRIVHEGARVILTGKTLPPLEATVRELVIGGADPKSIIAVDADLTEPEGRSKVIHAIDRHFRALDLAINAAEVGTRGLTETENPTDLRTLFAINVFALIDLTRALLPLLQAGKAPLSRQHRPDRRVIPPRILRQQVRRRRLHRFDPSRVREVRNPSPRDEIRFYRNRVRTQNCHCSRTRKCGDRDTQRHSPGWSRIHPQPPTSSSLPSQQGIHLLH
jgi:NAD(P)-dependent dehydrogenase (short-subunit alcohol dehydrogenase family)